MIDNAERGSKSHWNGVCPCAVCATSENANANPGTPILKRRIVPLPCDCNQGYYRCKGFTILGEDRMDGSCEGRCLTARGISQGGGSLASPRSPLDPRDRLGCAHRAGREPIRAFPVLPPVFAPLTSLTRATAPCAGRIARASGASQKVRSIVIAAQAGRRRPGCPCQLH